MDPASESKKRVLLKRKAFARGMKSEGLKSRFAPKPPPEGLPDAHSGPEVDPVEEAAESPGLEASEPDDGAGCPDGEGCTCPVGAKECSPDCESPDCQANLKGGSPEDGKAKELLAAVLRHAGK